MDENTLKVFKLVAGLMAVYGVATTAIILINDPGDNFTVIILRSYGTAFAAFIGVVAGFLAGSKRSGGPE